ncbi:MAG: type III polyketide synthase [Acetobacteraceae bacterium]|nr:type III polyketide synthase [Acetobacteraceae bacterium]
MRRAFLNRIGTAVPAFDIHAAFLAFGRAILPDERSRALFERMALLAEIDHRYSFLEPGPEPRDRFLDKARFYERGKFPSTAARMALYEPVALELAVRAAARLGLADIRGELTHLIVASCTGFSAPGLDLHLASALGLNGDVERSIVGFQGCFSAVSALRLARHIVRAEPGARVLVLNVELASLHLQEKWELETMLMFLLFADGASACLVSAEPTGIELGAFQAAIIPRSQDLITWHIGDQGFEMRLSGQVPGRIRRYLLEQGRDLVEDAIALWAVHAGGRTVLDAVQHGLALPPSALHHSREVLRAYGNMSSATLVFVLERILNEEGARGQGMAMAFGPGLSVETFRFRRVEGA